MDNVAARGFALLELTIAVLIATLLVVFAADRVRQKVNENAAENHAVWMTAVRQATVRYLEHHVASLAEQGSAPAIHGYLDPYAPTVAELRLNGMLSPGFPLHGSWGTSAGIRVVASNHCPSDSCRLEALIYSDHPLGKDAQHSHDPSLIAHWLISTAGHGGAVLNDSPSVIGGAGFSFPNPPDEHVATLPVGTVAMAITAEQMNQLAYLKVRDQRDPQLQGPATIAGDISAGATLRVSEHLQIGTVALAQTSCATEGAIVQEANGGLLICRMAQWVSAGGRGGGGYSMNSLTGCSSAGLNPVTGTCSCPSGYGPVRIADSTSAVPAEGRTRGYLCVG
ncbi:MAG TPA: hypothetical protein VKZ66_00700 [Pusillimonas sp.]|uniref:type II secretion system protein n=1 Tax=unclassified Pusillimonas TaxID=2640016 RepID=UPI00260906E0|nr:MULTISPECIES: hypothetical protein [unclassified Pusillimonas]HLU18451.1 hypothetical protein [Pusillimonas sp.]